ncbi:HutD family protein (plasmid) [Paraburkholderia sprentiae WSM5005]|uniref:HutD family protein n=1 Tax=Paraburkholderia sprentiae WSM5005 TaxID=754502 RepID=A0A1I9YUN6_9BURK|nr:HutD family protein [Paraburkholderia sprentiae]APA89922.1 HutD family protein [Paraburkholderia sprentiae WSM5005]
MDHDLLNPAFRRSSEPLRHPKTDRADDSVPSVRFIDCTSIAPEPWANGAGTTRTLAHGRNPAGVADWRVSLADLTGAARFSQFPGFERTLLLIDDGTVDLHSQDGQLLARTGQPVQFSGDLHVWVSLPTKPVQVLNVMARREACRAKVSVATNALRITPASVQLLISLSGEWSVSSTLLKNVTLSPMHGVWIERRNEELDLHHVGPGARLVSIGIEPMVLPCVQ